MGIQIQGGNIVANKCFKISKKKKILFNIINGIVCAGLAAVILLSSNVIQAVEQTQIVRREVVELTWRQQVRTSLADMKVQFIADIEIGLVDPYDKASVQKWADARVAGRKISGPGGDGFIIEFHSEEIIWDNSPDVAGETPRFLGDKIDQHLDPELAKTAYAEMRKIYSTDVNSHIYWNFDGSPEFLEWVILPTDSRGFGSEPYTIGGVKNPNYKAYLLGYGIQSDELFKPYLVLDALCERQKINIIIMNYVITIGGIVFLFWFLYRESTHE